MHWPGPLISDRGRSKEDTSKGEGASVGSGAVPGGQTAEDTGVLAPMDCLVGVLEGISARGETCADCKNPTLLFPGLALHTHTGT